MVSLGVRVTPMHIAIGSIFPFAVFSPDDQSLVTEDLSIVPRPGVSEKIWDWWHENDPFRRFNPPLATTRFRGRLKQVLFGRENDPLYVTVCRAAANTFNRLIRQTNNFLPESRQTADGKDLIIVFGEEVAEASRPKESTGLDILMDHSSIHYDQLFQKSPPSHGSGPMSSPSSSGSNKSHSPTGERETAAVREGPKKRRKRKKKPPLDATAPYGNETRRPRAAIEVAAFS